MKRHDITSFVSAMISFRCYHRPVYTDDNVVKIYDEEMKPIRRIYSRYSQLLDFDLSCSPLFYALNEDFEEVVTGEIIDWRTPIINSKPLLEDYDNDLPVERNLWMMTSSDYHKLLSTIRLTTVWGDNKFDNNSVTGNQAHIINSTLADNEAFAWYYSIVINKRFDEVVQIVPTFEDKLINEGLGIHRKSWYQLHEILLRYGELFLKLFYFDEEDGKEPLEESKNKFTMFKSNRRLPLKQIKINDYVDDPNYEWEPIDCNYDALVKFLNEEKARRGI